MPGENSNPYQYTKTIDQIIVERNNAKTKARADLAAAQEKAKKSNQLQNLYTQINEYRRLITLKERDISVTEAAIKAAQQAGKYKCS
jgi:Tfp pilus assembly protein FimV